MSKIFGIGLHRTGTSTLRECLRILGYSVCPEFIAYLTRVDVINKNFQPCIAVAKEFDAFEDSPWNYTDVFKILDAIFTDSKFILTDRDENQWFTSIMRFACLNGIVPVVDFTATLHCAPLPENRDLAIGAFRKHNNDVANYFHDKLDKLLIVNWEAGDGWDKLCSFLSKPVPDVPFPHVMKYDPITLGYSGYD